MAIRLPASERRTQLLNVALEEFAANGYHLTSMNQVAEAAGRDQAGPVPALPVEEGAVPRAARGRQREPRRAHRGGDRHRGEPPAAGRGRSPQLLHLRDRAPGRGHDPLRRRRPARRRVLRRHPPGRGDDRGGHRPADPGRGSRRRGSGAARARCGGPHRGDEPPLGRPRLPPRSRGAGGEGGRARLGGPAGRARPAARASRRTRRGAARRPPGGAAARGGGYLRRGGGGS